MRPSASRSGQDCNCVDCRRASGSGFIPLMGDAVRNRSANSVSLVFVGEIGASAYALMAHLRERRKACKPRPAKPIPIIAQIETSGTVASASTANSAAKRWPAAVGWTSSQKRNWFWPDGIFEQSTPDLGSVKFPVQHGPLTFVKPNSEGSALISPSKSYVSSVKTFNPLLSIGARRFIERFRQIAREALKCGPV